MNGPEQFLYSMNGGVGPQSYVQNSSYQRGILDVAEAIIEEIAKNLDMEQMCWKTLCIADFGCSTGHNSFPAMDLITQAINRKNQSCGGLKNPEFHVFFNDVVGNDFNTLYISLPHHRKYHAAGVAGDFHGRVLPAASLHVAYSSWALHWLSEAPKSCSNKGGIFYSTEKEVYDEYLDQFRKDTASFLESRAVEMVGGGIMLLLIPGVPELWDPETEYTLISEIKLLGSCLMDMANKGRLEEAKVDSFNMPIYFPTIKELESIFEKSESFSIERMETLVPGKNSLTFDARSASHRAAEEILLASHFGNEIIHDLFDLFTNKLAASPILRNQDNDKTFLILTVLKRTSS